MNLADAMRPQTFDDIVGQRHLTGDNALLMKLLSSGNFDSIMFVGPPGTGKTSMARLACAALGMVFYSLHAATAGAPELKKISDTAKNGFRSLIFVDEIHRYNKSQQDLLLKLIDDRLVKLVGASAENPYHNLVPALRSRSFIFSFKPVSDADMEVLARKAEQYFKESFGAEAVDTSECLRYIIENARGDARRFLNLLELSALIGIKENGVLKCSSEGLLDIAAKRAFSDDEYYDVLSAMIKSVRGSDPDAALLWGMKLIKNGVEPDAVFRRLMISASEDIGNAYPDAVVFVNAAYNSFTSVGVPEGLIILAHAITFLASCPKSNKSYEAFHGAMKYLENADPVVPENIAHLPKGYKYPFDYGSFVKQAYLPDGVQFYSPMEVGFEIKIKDRLKRLWEGTKIYE